MTEESYDDDIVFRAILAMDSYNRGHEPKLDLSKLNNENDTIGNAKIIHQSNTGEESEAIKANFSATAYSYSDEIVISYRGTDDDDVFKITSDFWQGWVTGGGAYKTSQATLSAKFYKEVLEQYGTTSNTPYTMKVSFTGHSLGGGLAGMMASLYGKKANIFDNMPFELAASNIYDASTKGLFDMISQLFSFFPSYNLFGEQPFHQTTKDTYYFNNAEVKVPNSDKIDAYAVTGEFLASARTIQDKEVKELNPHIGNLATAALNTFDMHSMGLLVLLLYAKTQKDSGKMSDDWTNIGPTLITTLFDNNIAKNAGILGFEDKNGTIKDNSAEHMQTKIAYSAIEEGALIFGDTAIKSLFDDANELGKVFSASNISSVLSDRKQILSNILVQFAGTLAENKVEAKSNANAQNGVLQLSINNQGIIQDITLDLSNSHWDGTDIHVRDQLFPNLYKTPGISPIFHSPSQSDINQVILAARDNGVDTSITNNTNPTTTLFVGGIGHDTVHGSNNKDILQGMDGNDDLYGHGGDDILRGGEGSGMLDGGTGIDLADFSNTTHNLTVDLTNNTATINHLLTSDTYNIFNIENIQGGFGQNIIHGDASDNTISGGHKDDHLHGNAGNDILEGRAGNDFLSGGANDDTYIFTLQNYGQDTITDSEGNNKLQFGDIELLVSEALSDGQGNYSYYDSTNKRYYTFTGLLDNGQIAKNLHDIDNLKVTINDSTTAPNNDDSVIINGFLNGDFGINLSGNYKSSNVQDIPVNTSSLGLSNDPDITYLHNGNTLIVWENTHASAIHAQLLDNSGNKIGSELAIGSGSKPAITTLQNGNVFLTFTGSSGGLVGKVLDQDAQLVSSFTISSNTSASQLSTQSIASLSNGNMVATWDGTELISATTTVTPNIDTIVLDNGNSVFIWQNSGVFARFTDPDGTQIGSDIQLYQKENPDDLVPRPHHSPTILQLSNGDALVMYNIKGVLNDKVYAQHISATGELIGDPITVQDSTGTDIEIVQDIEGTTYTVNDIAVTGTFAQIFANDGSKIGSLITTNGDNNAIVAAAPGGGFITVYYDNNLEQIRAQIFDNTGSIIKEEFIVENEVTMTSDVNGLAATYLENGTIAIVWSDTIGSGTGKSEILHRIYSHSGIAMHETSTLIAAEGTSNEHIVSQPQIVSLSEDKYIVTYTKMAKDGDGAGVYASMFDIDGNRINPSFVPKGTLEFLINGYTTGNQNDAAITVGKDGSFAVTWRDINNSGDGIYTRIFTAQHGATIQGTASIDNLHGTDNANMFNANDADDTVYAYGGNDYVLGGAGNDTIDGGAGNDVLDGGTGNNTLTGGADGDKYIIHQEADTTTIITDFEFDAGDEKIDISRFTNITNVDDLIITDNAEIGGIDINLGDNQYIHLAANSQNSTRSNNTNSFDSSKLQAGHFIFSLLNTITLSGTPDDDLLIGTEQNDTISGAAGADIIAGSSGNDLLSGEAGDDILVGGDGFDTLEGGDNNDILSGDAGGDILQGGSGDDGLAGGQGNDTLEGGEGSDLLTGGSGDDLLQGGNGDDFYHYITPKFDGDPIVTIFSTKNFGKDTIIDTNGSNRIIVDDIELTGSAQLIEGSQNKYALVKENNVYVMTMVNDNKDLQITINEDSANPTNSITIKDYANSNFGFNLQTSNTSTAFAVDPQDDNINSSKPDIAVMSDDSFIVIYSNYTATHGNTNQNDKIFAQKFDVLGNKIGEEFIITARAAYEQKKAAITLLENDNFLVTWLENNTVSGVIFDSNTNILVDEFVIAETNLHAHSTIATNNGGFIFLRGSEAGNVPLNITTTLYDENANILSQATQIGTTKGYNPRSITLANGEIIAFWYTNTYDLYMQRLNSDGTINGTESMLYDNSRGIIHKMTSLNDGGFALAWSETGVDGDGHGIRAQMFDANATPTSGILTVNTYFIGDQKNPSITSLTGGGFIVSWEGPVADHNANNSIYAQRYDANGAKVGEEFFINSSADADQEAPVIAALHQGGYITAWDNIQSSGHSAYAQIHQDSIYNKPIIYLGTSDDETYSGDTGHDSLIGNGGNDILSGEAGNDNIYGNWGDDILNGNAGADTLQGGTGDDELHGGLDADKLYGDSGVDTLNGDAGDDVLEGGIGNDILNGGTGNDNLIGGVGEDQYHFTTTEDYGKNIIIDSDQKGSLFFDGLQMNQRIIPVSNVPGLHTTKFNGTTYIFQQIHHEDADPTLDAPDLLISNASNDNTITIKNFINGTFNISLLNENLVNTKIGDNQYPATVFGQHISPSVAVAHDDSYMIVWADRYFSDTYAVNGQLFDENGHKIGESFQISELAYSQRFQPNITGLSNGNYVVYWQSEETLGSPFTDIHAVILDTSGAITTSEFVVNTTTESLQQAPAISVFDNDNFIITWQSMSSNVEEALNIYGKVFNAQGETVIEEFQVNSYAQGNQTTPTVAVLTNGNYVISWHSKFSQPYYTQEEGISFGTPIFSGTLFQIFDSQGNKIGKTVELPYTHGTFQPSSSENINATTALADDNFLITWDTIEGVYGQIFDSTGQEIGDNISIAPNYSVGSQGTAILYKVHNDDPQIAVLRDGGFIATWEARKERFTDAYDPSAQNEQWIIGQRYDNQGNKVNDEFIIDGKSHLDPTHPIAHDYSVSVQSDDDIIITWHHTIPKHNTISNQTLITENVYARIFTLNETTNFLPVALDDTVSIGDNWQHTFDILANDSEYSHNVISADSTVEIINPPSNGTLTYNNDGTATYTPNTDYTGTDTFTYKVTAGPDSISSIANVTINISTDNHMPIKSGISSLTTNMNTPHTLDVLEGSYDVDGDTLVPQLHSTDLYTPSHGTAEIIDNKLVYTPHTNFSGTDSFYYNITDGISPISQLLTVTVIRPDNTAPTAIGTIPDITIDAGDGSSEITLYKSNIITSAFSEPDTGDTLTYSLQGQGGKYDKVYRMINLYDNGEISVRPGIQDAGKHNITITATDSSGATATQSFILTVQKENINLPTANDVNASLIEDETYIINADELIIQSNATDLDDTDTVSIISVQNPIQGTVNLNSQTNHITFSPNENANGTAGFSFTVSDGNGGTVTKMVNLTITPINDAPTALELNLSTHANETLVITDANATDPEDGPILPTNNNITISNITDGASVQVNANNTLSYTPPADFIGTDSFTYTITDSDGTASEPATITIAISATSNTPPNMTLSNLSVSENAPGSIIADINIIDADTGDTHTLSVDDDRFEIVNNQLKLKDDISLNYEAETNGQISIEITVTNSANASHKQTFTLAITNVNEAPTINSSITDQNLKLNNSFNFVIPPDSFSDIDSPNLTYTASLENTPLPAWLNFDPATRTFSGTVPQDINLDPITIYVSASDGQLNSPQQTFTINITSNTHEGVNENGVTEGDDSSEVFVVPQTDYTIIGGGGGDNYIFSAASGVKTTIQGFDPNSDVLDISSFANIRSFDHLRITKGSAIIHLNDGQTIHIYDITPSDITSNNFAFATPIEGQDIHGTVSVSDLLQGSAGDDMLHYNADETWSEAFYALNMGSPDIILENGETVYVHPRYRSYDAFDGQDGYDIIKLTDEGDALALDDITGPTPLGEHTARIVNVEEVQAGGGDDIVDFTSFSFSYDDVRILGEDGNDVLWGNAGNDTILGGSGNDNIAGGSGDDKLTGGTGNDKLYGGAGADIITTGLGQDSIDFSFLNDSTATNRDTITDYDKNNDTLNFEQLVNQGIINIDDLTVTNDGSSTIISANDNDFEVELLGVFELNDLHFDWG